MNFRDLIPQGATLVELPGRPVPWARTRGGRHTPKRYGAYKRDLGLVASDASVARFGDAPVGLAVEVVLPDLKWQGDLDNYIKACGDALQGIVFDDDRQINTVLARKRLDRTSGGVLRAWIWRDDDPA